MDLLEAKATRATLDLLEARAILGLRVAKETLALMVVWDLLVAKVDLVVLHLNTTGALVLL